MVPGRVLVGGNYAHSGSSSTYVTLGRLPDWPAAPVQKVLTCSHPAKPALLPGPLYGAVERHGRRSGGLAATFTPVPEWCAMVISVPIANSSSAPVRVPGLTAEFAGAVLQGFQKLAPSPLLARLGAGRLEVSPAWWHEIDSGAYGFLDLAAKLLGVLTLSADASGEEVWNCWRNQDEALELAPILNWLSDALMRRPAHALFGPGTSPGALAALETRLGFPLPELLRRLLLCVDGGRFADQTPTPPSTGPRSRYQLLTVEQIAPAYFTLASEQQSHNDVPLLTPQRPLFRLRDDTLVPWPFLPVARDLESDDLLVLEVLPVPYSNRIQLAASQTPWREWPVLHRRFLEFVEEFLAVSRSPRTAPRPAS